jgi:hypothetical protein
MEPLDIDLPSVVKKQTDDGWTIATYNFGGVPLSDKFFLRESDADLYLQEQQDLINPYNSR